VILRRSIDPGRQDPDYAAAGASSEIVAVFLLARAHTGIVDVLPMAGDGLRLGVSLRRAPAPTLAADGIVAVCRRCVRRPPLLRRSVE